MTYIIDYASISPAVLDNRIRSEVMNALCTWKDIDEDYFEFSVCGWLPMCKEEICTIEKILADYV